MALSQSASSSSGLFSAFIDPVDMIGCFSAETSIFEVNQAAARHGLNFPLYCDPSRNLKEHFSCLEYAPASARFGACVDNVPGMNWKLPSGKVVRIGERVIKSTTGYDLLSFLLHSGEHFGSAQDYLLRLRPLGDEFFRGTFSGDPETLHQVRKDITHSTWSHWIDSFDWVIEAGSPPHIELTGNCLPDERSIFLQYFNNVVKKYDVVFELSESVPDYRLPSFSIKSVPSRAIETAVRCVDSYAGFARVLLTNGVVLANPESIPESHWLQSTHTEATQYGGHLFAPHLFNPALTNQESQWVNGILSDWTNL